MTDLRHRDLTLTLHDRGGDGLPLVLQHGLCGDARQTFEAAPQGQRVLTLDCPGHGTSDPDPDPSIAHFASDVSALIETLSGDYALGGISMGAAIALRLAVTAQRKPRALILIRPAWFTDAAPANMQPNAAVGALLARLPPDQARAAFADSDTARLLARTAPDNLTSLMGFFDRQPIAVTARLLSRISADGPGITPADLAALRLPTLVCGTAEDHVHPIALARDLARAIPQARFAELPAKGRDKAAHLAALHHEITRFLKDI